LFCRNEEKRKNKDDDDDDDSEIENDLYENDDNSNEVKEIPCKRLFGNDENEDDNGYIKDARKAFFENEAELSGDEADSDENFDGDSDEELVFSGDEDQVPNAADLKDELGRIYLKDQIDEDKRQVRKLKERYLADGELHQDKGFRKKQFRWKNVNGELDSVFYNVKILF
jgi:hypothetical protein